MDVGDADTDLQVACDGWRPLRHVPIREGRTGGQLRRPSERQKPHQKARSYRGRRSLPVDFAADSAAHQRFLHHLRVPIRIALTVGQSVSAIAACPCAVGCIMPLKPSLRDDVCVSMASLKVLM
jgi:hypothetical protein